MKKEEKSLDKAQKEEESLDEAQIQFIAQEEKILGEVLLALAQEGAHHVDGTGGLRDRLVQLRDGALWSNDEERAALLEQMYQLRSLEAQRRPTSLPQWQTPYLAHMRLEEEERSWDILLGTTSFSSRACPYPIIDWRKAPLARIFFDYRTGDEYEEQLPGRLAEGILALRHIVTIHQGELIQILTDHGCYRKGKDGRWRYEEATRGLLRGGEGKALRHLTRRQSPLGLAAPEVVHLLDEEQLSLLHEDDRVPLLVRGGAGSGKTTVALHRISFLASLHPKRYSPSSMIVIVPEPGLARLCQNLLQLLGLGEVQIITFDDWVIQQTRRILGKIPLRLCPDTPARVVELKRHPAVFRLIESYLAEEKEEIAERFLRKVPGCPCPQEAFAPQRPGHLLAWLQEAERQIHAALPPANKALQKETTAFFQEERRRLPHVWDDRLRLFGNRPWLEKMQEEAPQEITPATIEETLRHTRAQFSELPERAYFAEGATLPSGLDGHSLEWGTPDEIQQTIDVEDLAVLLEVLRQKTGKLRLVQSLQTYTHMVIDEAQELTPIELSLLGRALRKPKSVTIAGDAAQQTDTTTTFLSWERVLEELQVRGVRSGRLSTNYRSPRPIAHFAHQLLGPLAGDPPQAPREGLPVSLTRFANQAQATLVLLDHLSDLLEREPYSSVALIAREEETAQRLFSELQVLPEVRLIQQGDFSFKPGVDITTVAAVKGLEFDYVIIPDANLRVYGEDNLSRRALHVACTRAIHQLWLLSTGTPSPILPRQP